MIGATGSRGGLRLGILLAFMAAGNEAAAQVGAVGNPRVVSLAALKPGTLTVGVASGMVQNLPNVVDEAANDFPVPVVIVTQWNVNPGQTNTVNLMAYFTVPAQAMVGPIAIPSSRIMGQVTTGLPAAFTAFTQSAVGGIGTAGGSLRLFSQNITGANKNASRTDNLNLRLNLVGFGPLPPGTYTGTLNIRAVTQ